MVLMSLWKMTCAPAAALPMGRGQAGRYEQPYVQFEHFEAVYKSAGGTSK